MLEKMTKVKSINRFVWFAPKTLGCSEQKWEHKQAAWRLWPVNNQSGPSAADDIKRIPPPHWLVNLVMFPRFSGGLCSHDQTESYCVDNIGLLYPHIGSTSDRTSNITTIPVPPWRMSHGSFSPGSYQLSKLDDLLLTCSKNRLSVMEKIDFTSLVMEVAVCPN